MAEPKSTSSIPRGKANAQDALNAFLVAADSLARKGEVVAAEVRFKQALSKAEKEFGPHSDQVMLVLSILSAFYHQQQREIEAGALEYRIQHWQMEQEQESDSSTSALGKQLTAKRKRTSATGTTEIPVAKTTPRLRKACQILGLSPEKGFTIQDVNKAWKRQMLAANAHPDLGGNVDEAAILNNAKEMLIEYLESLAPKLGAKFNKRENQ